MDTHTITAPFRETVLALRGPCESQRGSVEILEIQLVMILVPKNSVAFVLFYLYEFYQPFKTKADIIQKWCQREMRTHPSSLV